MTIYEYQNCYIVLENICTIKLRLEIKDGDRYYLEINGIRVGNAESKYYMEEDLRKIIEKMKELA
jgi:hypothetical protein